MTDNMFSAFSLYFGGASCQLVGDLMLTGLRERYGSYQMGGRGKKKDMQLEEIRPWNCISASTGEFTLNWAAGNKKKNQFVDGFLSNLALKTHSSIG